MYQVLLADDEQSILDSLKENIPWAEYGLEVIQTASSGKQVYDLLKKWTPDIALLDIRMPGYSGLELSHLLSEKNPQTQVIIISGYAEFSYAQKAIQYGVLGYCLKPLEYDEIIKLLLKAIHNLDQTSSVVSADDFLEAIEENNLSEIENYLSGNGFSDNPCYLAASTGDAPLPLNGIITLSIGNAQYVYLSSSPYPLDQLAQMLTSQETDSGILGIGIYVASPVTVKTFRSAFYRCISMAHNFFIDPENRICLQLDTHHSMFILSQIQSAAGFGDRKKIILLLNQLLSEGSYRHFSIQSAQQLYNTIISTPQLMPGFEDYYICSYRQLVGEYGTFRNMLENLKHMIETVPDHLEEPIADMSNSHFLKIISYINTYYRENITLNDVAAVANLTPNYISQIFRKQAGVTFSTYLARLRVDNARKLLDTTCLSISEISARTGFNDYFYFLKTFKKYTGKTPSEYRTDSQESPLRSL